MLKTPNMVSPLYKAFGWFMSLFPVKVSMLILFYRRFRYVPDLNNPQTFNEKIFWRKLNDFNPLYTTASDKLKSKEFIREVCPEIKIPNSIFQGKDFNDLDISKLPDNYVIKANHGSAMSHFVTNRQHLTKYQMGRLTKKWLSHDLNKVFGQWGYKNIEKKVFIEEFLWSGDDVPSDLKFFVFHGEVRFIQYDQGRFQDHKRNMLLKDWSDLNINYSHERAVPPPKPPGNLKKLIQVSEKIGAHFDFIRVDLYNIDEEIYFGELTVYPGGGFEVFENLEDDLLFGSYWNLELPRNNKIQKHKTYNEDCLA